MAKQQEPAYSRDGAFVHLTNPETDGQWWCPVGVADVYVEKRGWELSEPPDDSLDGLFDEEAGFDPAEHTVGEVNAHLAAHLESAPGEVDRVLALEATGKNRTTVHDPRNNG